ncbi:hypothetical protein JYB64_21255 [Algoriphagus aestuarii]|nr:hypothetical protein [Algoriphagus aestuarii]
MRHIVEQLRNPVRARAVVLALLTLLGVAVPGLAGIEANDALVGGIMALMAIVLGWDNSAQNTPRDNQDNKENA